MLVMETPRLSYLALGSYNYLPVRTSAGFTVRLALLKMKDLPTESRKCSICYKGFVVNHIGKFHALRPVALDCGHVYCASCVLERVDFEKDPFQGCVECDPKISQSSMLNSGSFNNDNAGISERSSDRGMTLRDSSSSKRALSSLVDDKRRTDDITKKITMTNIRAVELLTAMSRHMTRTNCKRPPTQAQMSRALRTFNARYECNLDLQDLDGILAMTNMRNGTSVSAAEALGPWL
ncbi:MAG: hypothetical protein Q9164_007101 [Protoblastenia rupestris]